MEEIIRLDNVSYIYGDTIPALVDIDLSVGRGERFALIGSNGTGKSTLLRIMNGLLRPSRGKVLFRGQEVSDKTLSDRRFLKHFRTGMGFLFQDPDVQLFCPTVLDELMFGPLQLGLTDGEPLQRAIDVMDMLGIRHLQDRPCHMLSGGEKKRVAIASVLTMNPDVLLLDEPTDSLDPKTRSFMMELMISLSEAGKTLVLATHDLSLVGSLQCLVAVLSEDHRLEITGSANDILRDEALLVKLNLIHEQRHYHGDKTHAHLYSPNLLHHHHNGSS